ncbi:molybdate ABC transporter substrate-binding protein [Ectothiorhodospira mobilis]|uniref:molybdate ABC transporter substrate-binding protein n=1 Tax=Ectothiorhodospira mobilis TaxID=195064 RepID=UPI0019076B9F|nr:molybdate ABC transporter substrate-binding protein [Ectothiorhodospira mobilis]MBK1691012.1 molybdate ABC transporter substrate-binding protein [Ectothiorhodospira mobilis]
MKRLFVVFSLWAGLVAAPASVAEEIRVAVAANFLGTLERLVPLFEQESGHDLVLSAGSSGALYAQIVHGAPFHVFFSADDRRPRALVDEGLAVPDSRKTYAVGVPVLWSAGEMDMEDPRALLGQGDYRFLSVADPRNAPYGEAAREILQSMGMWTRLQEEGRLIRARSIGQTYSQVASGAAELGFVALSQVRRPDGSVPGSHWIPPEELYAPIQQQRVLLQRAADFAPAREFLEWMTSDTARGVIEAAGYAVPEAASS